MAVYSNTITRITQQDYIHSTHYTRSLAVFIYISHVLYPDEKVMADDEFTCDLFRFLQLLCEGHNNGNYFFSCSFLTSL